MFIISREFFVKFSLCLLLAITCYVSLGMISNAHATSGVTNTMANDTLAKGMCNAVYYITSGVGKAIAVLCVIFLGVGLFFGKTNWALAFSVCLGIACIFGAAYVMKVILGENIVCGDKSNQITPTETTTNTTPKTN